MNMPIPNEFGKSLTQIQAYVAKIAPRGKPGQPIDEEKLYHHAKVLLSMIDSSIVVHKRVLGDEGLSTVNRASIEKLLRQLGDS